MERDVIQIIPLVSVATLITVGFDALLHGLSHGSHGLLDALWRGEKTQRSSSTTLLGSVGWHISSDVLLGIVLALLIAFIEVNGLHGYVIIGLLFGCLAAMTWMHVYAALEVSGRLVTIPSGLGIAQFTLISVVTGLVKMALVNE